MIKNPKIGQKVWFAEACNQRIHSAKLIALDEVEVSTRKYLYAKIEMDDGCRLGWPLKNLYASKEELQKELEKKKKGSNKIENEKQRVSITLSTRQISHLSVAALKIEY